MTPMTRSTSAPATSTDEAFAEFDEALKLDPDERARAERIHGEIAELLIGKGLATSAFLQGSFRRKTMIKPLRDVDKVVILHESLRGLNPSVVMDRIEQVLSLEYPSATFGRTRHSLKIDLGPKSFDFDVVPAWESETDDDDVFIADTEPVAGSDGWMRSNTRELIRVVAGRNQETGGALIRQIRMAKHVFKEQLDGVVPGLHVESWAFLAIVEAVPHDKALAMILRNAADRIGRHYDEPTGVDRISDRLDTAVVDAARPILLLLASRAAEARVLAEAGDHVEAVRVWREVCGDLFHEEPAQSVSDALGRSFNGGAVTSAGTVSATPAAAQRSIPARSWRLA